MDSFEVNKILGAVLGTLTFTIALGIGAQLLFETEAPAKPGFEIAVPKSGGEAEAAPKVESIAVRLAKANPKRGESLSAQCAACHNFKEGQGPKVGPDLYGVVGRPIAAQKGFSYSAALKKLAAKEKTWTIDNLNTWITNPQHDAPGTAMTFSGISSEKQRAAVVAFLNQNSDHPEPLKTEAQAPKGNGGATAANGQAAPPKPAANGGNVQPGAPKAPSPAGGGNQGSSGARHSVAPGQETGAPPPAHGLASPNTSAPAH